MLLISIEADAACASRKLLPREFLRELGQKLMRLLLVIYVCIVAVFTENSINQPFLYPIMYKMYNVCFFFLSCIDI